MADISTTLAIVATLTDESCTLSRRLAVRESVPVSTTDSNGGTWPAGAYHLTLSHGATVLADAALTGGSTTTLTGTLDLTADAALEAFPQHGAQSTSGAGAYDPLRCVLTLYNATTLTAYVLQGVNVYWQEEIA